MPRIFQKAKAPPPDAIRSGAIDCNSSEESSGAGGLSRHAPERRTAIKELRRGEFSIYHFTFDIFHLRADGEAVRLNGI